MWNLKKSNAAMPAMVLALSMAGVAIKCQDSDLAKAVDSLTIATHSLEAAKNFQKEFQVRKKKEFTDLYDQKKLTKEEVNAQWEALGKDAIVAADITIALTQATDEVNTFTKTLVQLDPAARTNIMNLMKPLIAGFTHAIETELPRIKNPELKTTILGYLSKSKGALELVLSLMEGGK